MKDELAHVNPNCKSALYCKPHGESGPVEHKTLSELIEACGDYFVLMLHNPLRGEWLVGDAMPNGTAKHHGVGNTPEEAVARLWLALNRSAPSKEIKP